MSQFLAANETGAHLEVLALQGELTREVSPNGVDLYQVAGRSRTVNPLRAHPQIQPWR